MPAPRILFFGYSEVGYECLSLLLERGDHVVALVTHEDNPHEKIWFKTPAVAAREKGVPVLTPENINTPEWCERLAALQPDLILSVYYRNMIGTKILGLPRLGAWNLHGSLLPAYRGRPGEILSVNPLVVATADGALELTKTEWRGAPADLRPGGVL